MTATSSGQRPLRRRIRSSGGSTAVSKLATWPSAWTPVSVRPATVSSTGSRRTVARAVSSSPCTVRRPGLARPAAEAGAVVFDVESVDGGARRQYLDSGAAMPRHLESGRCASSSPTTTASPRRGCRPPGGRWSSSTASRSTSIAPDSNRSATARSITTRSPLSVEEVNFDDGRVGYADRRHAGRLRPLRRAGPGRRPARPDRLRDQPRRQPRRRHHLLGHGRRGAGGDRPRDPGDRPLPAVLGRRPRLRQRQVRLRRRRPLHRPAGLPPARGVDAGGDADQRQLPQPRADRDRGDEARQTDLQRRAEAGQGERRPPPLRDLRLAAGLRGDRGHRPLRGRQGADLGHPDPLRPHRPRRHRAPAAAGASRRCWRQAPTTA